MWVGPVGRVGRLDLEGEERSTVDSRDQRGEALSLKVNYSGKQLLKGTEINNVFTCRHY